MLTQAELYCNGEFRVRWIEHDPHELPLKKGMRLFFAESGNEWIVVSTWLSLNDSRALPPKAKTATILHVLEGDGLAELASVHPRISVV